MAGDLTAARLIVEDGASFIGSSQRKTTDFYQWAAANRPEQKAAWEEAANAGDYETRDHIWKATEEEWRNSPDCDVADVEPATEAQSMIAKEGEPTGSSQVSGDSLTLQGSVSRVALQFFKPRNCFRREDARPQIGTA